MSNYKRNLALQQLDEIESFIDCLRDSVASNELSQVEHCQLFIEIEKIYEMFTDLSGKES
jgi:hypothetical protein